jgi:tetratricopeptide (TPR) repeat protein
MSQLSGDHDDDGSPRSQRRERAGSGRRDRPRTSNPPAGRGDRGRSEVSGGAKRAGARRGEGDRKGGPRSGREPVHLADDIVTELHATTRPGKGELLVQLFAEAAGAFAADDYPTAIRLADQAKHMALRAPVIRELLGLAHYRAGNWRDAARELAAFRRISGSTEQNPVIADCYRALGRPERAIELCDEIDPRAAPAIFYEGAIVAAGALADLSRLDEGIARLEQLRLEPRVAQEHHVRAWYALGDLLERRGRFTQALRWFESAAGADPDLTDAPDRVARLRRRA